MRTTHALPRSRNSNFPTRKSSGFGVVETVCPTKQKGLRSFERFQKTIPADAPLGVTRPLLSEVFRGHAETDLPHLESGRAGSPPLCPRLYSPSRDSVPSVFVLACSFSSNSVEFSGRDGPLITSPLSSLGALRFAHLYVHVRTVGEQKRAKSAKQTEIKRRLARLFDPPFYKLRARRPCLFFVPSSFNPRKTVELFPPIPRN